MEQLAAEREVIAIDMPGFGESPLAARRDPPRAANLATAVLDFYDALGIDGKPAVAGISLGGWVAIECARQGGAAAAVGLCTAGFWKRSPDSSNRTVARARRSGRATRALLRPMMSDALADAVGRSAASSTGPSVSARARRRRSPRPT